MLESPFTAELARQRRAELLRAAAARCCRVAAPHLADRVRRFVAAVRADARRMQLGPQDTACQTC